MDLTILLSSTLPWYQLISNQSVIFTHGAVFIEINALSVPFSLAGVNIVHNQDDMSVITGVTFDRRIGIPYGENRTQSCLPTDYSSREIPQIVMNYLSQTLVGELNKHLPSALQFLDDGFTLLKLKDIRADLLKGSDVQKMECHGAPLYEDHLYTVFRFGRNFSMTWFGKRINFLPLTNNEMYCFIIDICTDLGRSAFLMLPENSKTSISILHRCSSFPVLRSFLMV